jgi:hypothetical protein
MRKDGGVSFARVFYWFDPENYAGDRNWCWGIGLMNTFET